MLIPLVAVLLAVGVLLIRPIFKQPPEIDQVSATVLAPPRIIEDFQLVDHHNEPFTLNSLKGKWSFVFFGYTHCPDVCPLTMHTLSRMETLLAGESTSDTGIQVVFVSVDPQRDTVEKLAAYVPYFHQRFLGVTGREEEIKRLTKQLGIFHLHVEQGKEREYLMDHTTSILLFEPSGALRALFGAPHEAQRLAKEFLIISGES
jgi:protein SCO1/2